MAEGLLFKNVLEIGPAQEPSIHHFGPVCVPIPGDDNHVILKMDRNVSYELIVKILVELLKYSDDQRSDTRNLNSKAPNMSLLMTQEEVSDVLRCSITKVQRLRIMGELSYIPGNPVQIIASSIDEYINRKKVPTRDLIQGSVKVQRQDLDPAVADARARARRDILLQRLHDPQKRMPLTEEEKQRRVEEGKRRQRAKERRAKTLERAKAAKAAKSKDQPKTPGSSSES